MYITNTFGANLRATLACRWHTAFAALRYALRVAGRLAWTFLRRRGMGMREQGKFGAAPSALFLPLEDKRLLLRSNVAFCRLLLPLRSFARLLRPATFLFPALEPCCSCNVSVYGHRFCRWSYQVSERRKSRLTLCGTGCRHCCWPALCGALSPLDATWRRRRHFYIWRFPPTPLPPLPYLHTLPTPASHGALILRPVYADGNHVRGFILRAWACGGAGGLWPVFFCGPPYCCCLTFSSPYHSSAAAGCTRASSCLPLRACRALLLSARVAACLCLSRPSLLASGLPAYSVHLCYTTWARGRWAWRTFPPPPLCGTALRFVVPPAHPLYTVSSPQRTRRDTTRGRTTALDFSGDAKAAPEPASVWRSCLPAGSSIFCFKDEW